MNISPFGEILVQFRGFEAAIIAFCYGGFLCFGIRSFMYLMLRNKISILPLPYLLTQIYKIETDMLTVGNLILKVLVFSWILCWIEKKIKIFN